MPLAMDRLEVLQVRKLIQCVRTHDTTQISKMAEQGVPGVLDIQGESVLLVIIHCIIVYALAVVLLMAEYHYRTAW